MYFTGDTRHNHVRWIVLDSRPKEFIDNYNSESLNKGMLTKTDLNGTLVFLLSDDLSYINGQNIIVDDGFSL